MVATLGQISGAANAKRSVCLLPPTTANTAIPSAVTDGIACYPDPRNINSDQGHCYLGQAAKESTLMVHATVTAGQVLVGTLTLWGYLAASGQWYEIPTNGGTKVTPVAFAETDTDRITHVERFLNLGHFDRLCLQLTAIGGTGASFEAWLTTAQESY